MARRGRFGQRPGEDVETRFADIAPTFDGFPGFAPRDFEVFAAPHQRDAGRNGERLVVKRKLAELGKVIGPRLEAEGLSLTVRTSLSHPFKHNGFRVSSQWVYWGRSDKEKTAIKKKLGAELGKDLDPTYHGVCLVAEIDEHHVAAGLKIHPNAWWDGQNLKKRFRGDAASAEELCRLLNALPRGFAMWIGGFRRRYEMGALRPQHLSTFFEMYVPGEKWLHIAHETPKADALAAGAGLAERLAERLCALAPLYRFVCWSAANNAIL